MKTITLKLTQEEYQILDNKNLSHLGIGFLFSKPVNCKKGIDVLDVDKFREFLLENITDLVGDFLNDQNLKSILQKLAFEYVKFNSSPMIGFDTDDSYVQIKASDLNDICEIAKSLMKFAKRYGYEGDSVIEDRAYNILVKAQQPLQERDPQNI